MRAYEKEPRVKTTVLGSQCPCSVNLWIKKKTNQKTKNQKKPKTHSGGFPRTLIIFFSSAITRGAGIESFQKKRGNTQVALNTKNGAIWAELMHRSSRWRKPQPQP